MYVYEPLSSLTVPLQRGAPLFIYSVNYLIFNDSVDVNDLTHCPDAATNITVGSADLFLCAFMSEVEASPSIHPS